jgi:hypothetical protein
MPAPLTTSLIAFGAVLTALSATAGAAVAAVGLVLELAVSVYAPTPDA